MDVPESSRRALVAAACAALPALVVGCSGEEDGGSESSAKKELAATESPEHPLEPTDVPTRWRTVEGKRFTIGVPGSFTSDTKQASNGSTMYLFDAPGSAKEASRLARVAVVRDVKPKSDALSQSYVLKQFKAVENEQPPVRSKLTWPGIEKPAYLVQWTTPIGGGQGAKQETWPLMVQVDPELIINVVAVAPAGTLEKKKLVQIMSTFRVA